MKTIVLAGLKGGVGKTTIGYNLAVEAAREGKSIFLVDRDPSRGLTMLYGIREEAGGIPNNLTLLEQVGRLSEAKKQLVEMGHDRDFMICDTPNAYMEIVDDALHAADCIVIPVRPSPLDIIAQQDISTPITKLGKTPVTLFVLNMVDRRAMAPAKDAMKKITPLFPNKPVWVSQRLAFSRAAETGRAGSEIDKAAANEIADLWKAINKILRKGEGRHAKIQSRQSEARHIGR